MNALTSRWRTRLLMIVVIVLLIEIASQSLVRERVAALAQPIVCPGSGEIPNNAIINLDQTERDWGVYCEGHPQWRMRNVSTPSLDGKSLECAITGGDQYSNVHCYRNLTEEPESTMFTMDMLFWFSATTCNNVGGDSVVQALEFTMNKWDQGKRYEFAIQWMNAGAGGPQWRYWDGNQIPEQRWMSFNPPITQCLVGGNANRHSLRLEGTIVQDQIDLRSFTIDGVTHATNLLIPAITDVTLPDQLAVAVQVDGNINQSPYSLFIDRVNFVRWNTLLSSIGPENGTVFPSNRPTFTWSPVPEATYYELQIDNANPPRSAPVRVATTSFTPTSLPSGEYHWRVRGVNASTQASPWTRSRCLIIQPLLNSTPSLNVYSTRTPTLTWNPVSWATGYELQIDDEASFNSPLEYTMVSDTPILSATTPSLDSCTHYWRIRAIGSNSERGPWSNVLSFFIGVM
jgi:hypothetical protein